MLTNGIQYNHRKLFFAVALGLSLALLNHSWFAASASRCLDRYLVRSGDTLTGIATAYGFSWRVLAEINDLEQPYDLLAGQWLCLPANVGAEAAAATPHPSRVPAYTVEVSAKWVQVHTINFPVKSNFIVRITEVQDSQPAITWYKVGILRAPKGGAVNVRFRLPDELKEGQKFQVCLKNSTNDAVSCKEVRRR